LPGGGPFAATIQSNGILKLAQPGSANNLNPMTIAIDPTGSVLFQTSQGSFGNTPAGIFVYKIDRATGSPGPATDSYTAANVSFYDDVVDEQGKFLFAYGGQGVYAFTIDAGTGTIAPIAGSPFAASTTSSPGYTQAATLMAVDQTNKFLYVSTSKGIYAYTIDQSTGALTLIPGSPFAVTVTGSWTIAITPTNSYLYQLQASSNTSIYAYSVNQTSGVLTPVSGSPFSAGTCGTMVPPGTVGIPGPDNMTIASAGKFMYDNCGIYSIDESTGAIAQVSNKGPGDWPVIDPTGDFLWALTGDQTSCFHCDEGVTTYSVNPTTGALSPVPNSFLFLTNSEVGAVNSLAITK
jgi:6-phosphogluconolactonase (cycloisomerase 2 family)